MMGKIIRMLSGYRKGLDAARKGLLASYSASTAADWLLERRKDEYGYYGLPGAEGEIIAFGQAAVPIAEEFLASFDHRIRCSGLTIMSEIVGSQGRSKVFVEHLDDPYSPIRMKCWHALKELSALPAESAPPACHDYLRHWKRLKSACRIAAEVVGDKGILFGQGIQGHMFCCRKGGFN